MRNHSGFSLLNVVVMLGGLVIVAAMLWPVFVRRPSPGRNTCQSNLKQILLGFKQYTQDNDGNFPPLAAAHLSATQPSSSGWVGLLQLYLKSLQIFQCQSETNSRVGFTDYAYNSPVIARKNEEIFANSANTIILCETNESEGSLASASGPVVVNRHLEGSNYAFVDGHVKWLHSTRAPSPSNVHATGTNFTFGS